MNVIGHLFRVSATFTKKAIRQIDRMSPLWPLSKSDQYWERWRGFGVNLGKGGEGVQFNKTSVRIIDPKRPLALVFKGPLNFIQLVASETYVAPEQLLQLFCLWFCVTTNGEIYCHWPLSKCAWIIPSLIKLLRQVYEEIIGSL